MFHGGTNFGFMAGANEGLGATNEGNKQPYQPDITSYGERIVIVIVSLLLDLGNVAHALN